MTELTKREQFVKAAMHAFLTDPNATRPQFPHLALLSVEVADLVLAELKRPKNTTPPSSRPPSSESELSTPTLDRMGSPPSEGQCLSWISKLKKATSRWLKA